MGFTSQLVSWATDPATEVSPWSGIMALNLTFAGSDFVAQSMGVLPNKVLPGQYRALLFVRRLSTAGSCRISVGVDPWWADAGSGPTTAPVSVAPPDGQMYLDGWWVDLGRLNLPPGVDATDLPPDALPDDMSFSVTFEGNGVGSWMVGRFFLAPVSSSAARSSSTVLQTRWSSFPFADGTVRVDGDRSRIGLIDPATDSWLPAIPPVVDGTFPRLQPGARNWLLFLPKVAPSAQSAGGSYAPAKLWYHPRYLQVGHR